jgi:hypothetical protein
MRKGIRSNKLTLSLENIMKNIKIIPDFISFLFIDYSSSSVSIIVIMSPEFVSSKRISLVIMEWQHFFRQLF